MSDRTRRANRRIDHASTPVDSRLPGVSTVSPTLFSLFDQLRQQTIILRDEGVALRVAGRQNRREEHHTEDDREHPPEADDERDHVIEDNHWTMPRNDCGLNIVKHAP